MSQVWSVNGSASGSARHIAEVMPASSEHIIAKAHGGRADLFRHRQHGIHAHSALSSAAALDTPTVFVVDDDVSVRESLELLIGFEGWEPETFASAQEFLARPRTRKPSWPICRNACRP